MRGHRRREGNGDGVAQRPAPDDLKHNSRQILLLFVSGDDLKQENGQILL
jgi:hypothetical protein